MEYFPHRHQSGCHISLARDRNSCAGRRGGKTHWTAKEVAAYMLGPYRICLLGPTYDQAYKEFRDVRDAIRHPAYPYAIDRLIDNKDAGNLVIKTAIGAELEVRSAANMNKSPVIGEEYDLMVFCEGARIIGMGGEGGLWESQLRGNLTTRLGGTITPTTPAGKDNFLHPRFTLGLSGTDKDMASFQWAAYANPMYPEDIGKMYRLMSRRAFREQVLGEFVSWAGSIWSEDCGWDSRQHVIHPFRIPPWWNRIEVIDPGFSDDLAWIAAVVSPDNKVYGVDEFAMKKTSYSEIAEQIIFRRNLAYNGNPPPQIPVYVDPEDPRCAFEISKAASEVNERITCLKADNDVNNGFLMASARIRSNMFYMTSNCVKSIEALDNHEWSGKENSRGKTERRDRYKHFSDTWRYLQLAPIIASTYPQVVEFKKETYEDIINEQRGVGGNQLSDFMEMMNRWAA